MLKWDVDRLSHWSKLIAIFVLLIILPFFQLVQTRSATISLAISFGFFFIGMVLDHRNSTFRQHASYLTSSILAVPTILPFLLFSAYNFISLIWVLDWIEGGLFAATVGGGVIGSALYLNGIKEWKVPLQPIFLLVVLAMLSVLLFLEYRQITSLHKIVSENRLHDLNRSSVFLTMILWVAMLWPTQTWRMSIIKVTVFILASFAIFSGLSDTAKLTMLVTSVIFLVQMVMPSAVRLILPALAIYILSFPFLTPMLAQIDILTKGDLAHYANAGFRIALWNEYLAFVLEKPIFGWGAEMHKWIGQSGLMGPVPSNLVKSVTMFTPNHPHNNSIEIWVNSGLIGALLIAGSLLLLNRLVSPKNTSSNMLTLVTCSCVVTGAFTISTGQGWYLAQMVAVALVFRLCWVVEDPEIKLL